MDYFVIDRTCLYDKTKAICLKYTTKILCSNSKINFGDISLKIKQLRYLLFSSQQLPAWVYSCIILEDEC